MDFDADTDLIDIVLCCRLRIDLLVLQGFQVLEQLDTLLLGYAHRVLHNKKFPFKTLAHASHRLEYYL